MSVSSGWDSDLGFKVQEESTMNTRVTPISCFLTKHANGHGHAIRCMQRLLITFCCSLLLYRQTKIDQDRFNPLGGVCWSMSPWNCQKDSILKSLDMLRNVKWSSDIKYRSNCYLEMFMAMQYCTVAVDWWSDDFHWGISLGVLANDRLEQKMKLTTLIRVCILT